MFPLPAMTRYPTVTTGMLRVKILRPRKISIIFQTAVVFGFQFICNLFQRVQLTMGEFRLAAKCQTDDKPSFQLLMSEFNDVCMCHSVSMSSKFDIWYITRITYMVSTLSCLSVDYYKSILPIQFRIYSLPPNSEGPRGLMGIGKCLQTSR